MSSLLQDISAFDNAIEMEQLEDFLKLWKEQWQQLHCHNQLNLLKRCFLFFFLLCFYPHLYDNISCIQVSSELVLEMQFFLNKKMLRIELQMAFSDIFYLWSLCETTSSVLFV